MTCPSCPGNFLVLVICRDKVYRCVDCRRLRAPAKAPEPAAIGETQSRFVKDMRKRAGLCPRCGKPAGGMRYCAEHREEYRLASMARRERERA